MVRNIAIGCDPNAKDLKRIILEHLLAMDYEVIDYGSEDPIYANTALEVASAVAEGKHDRGILLCGTGLGMSLAANKVFGAYAVACSDTYSVERSIKSNNANILALGALVVGAGLARMLVTLWLSLSYDPEGTSEPKNQRIYEIEKQFMKPLHDNHS